MSQKPRKVSQNGGGNVRDDTRARIRETGQMSRPASRPGTSVPLSQGQRFASWLAGATEAQVEAWKRRTGR